MYHYLRLFAALLLLALAVPVQAEDDAAPTPLRLSYYKGDVAVYREQGDGWEEVRLNLPLASGDALDSGAASGLELQLGSHAYIRADSHTRLQLAGQELRSLRLEIDSGRVAFDLRELPEDGYLVDVNVHGALFTLERPGYYRFDVDQDVRLSVRQGGQASVIPASGEELLLHTAETLWLTGGDATHIAVSPAAEPDAWDRWNLTRSDELIASSSTRYLPAGIAGAYDLDRYGSWRITQSYGPVWMPHTVAPGWTPYGSGYWVWDPYYRWTWVDDAPWGWAPFHYGRWVYLGSRWVWAPGPLVRRPLYSPALVAFFALGPLPAYRTCWVALGWGEPVMTWWGRPTSRGKPSWRGWGGPKVVNRAHVKPTTTINIGSIVYANSQISNALVAAAPEQFGRKDMHKARLSAKNRTTLTPLQGVLPQPQPQPQAQRSRSQPQAAGQERALRRAEDRMPEMTRSQLPEQRGTAATAPRSDEVRPAEPQRRQRSTAVPGEQGDRREPVQPQDARRFQSETVSTGTGRLQGGERKASGPAAYGQLREPRQPTAPREQAAAREMTRSRAEEEPAAPVADGGDRRGQPVQQRTLRATPYGLDPESRVERTRLLAYPPDQPTAQRWGTRQQQGQGASPAAQ